MYPRRTCQTEIGMLLDAIQKCMKKEFTKVPPTWKILPTCPESDMLFLKKECNAPSEFDPMQLRKAMIDGLDHATSHMTVASCPYGTVYAVYHKPTDHRNIPWELWGRILRMYTEKNGKNTEPFKIFFLANDTVRQFPKGSAPIQPTNINGGYTYPCNHATILIYRAEDATRVLLHELMHACCLDTPENGIDHVEAETEAWAELVYAGFLSEGNMKQLHALIAKQSAWMIEQNKKVKQHMKSVMDFPWRYTVGKEEVWRRWGILVEPSNSEDSLRIGNSLRLTSPPDHRHKRRYNIGIHSTIL